MWKNINDKKIKIKEGNKKIKKIHLSAEIGWILIKNRKVLKKYHQLRGDNLVETKYFLFKNCFFNNP